MKKLIIIPTYNECDNIVALIEAILALEISSLSILVVDDNSPDGTADCVRHHFVDLIQQGVVSLLLRSNKEGLGKAYLAAFAWALQRDFVWIVQMDADFSHHPRYLPDLFSAAAAGADLVLGSRYVKGGGTKNWGLLRRCISRFGGIYARCILGLSVKDLTGGFKCFRRTVLEKMPLDDVECKGYAFQIEMTYRAILQGASVKEVPIVFEDRCIGQSKMTRLIILEAVYKVLLLRLQKNKLVVKAES